MPILRELWDGSEFLHGIGPLPPEGLDAPQPPRRNRAGPPDGWTPELIRACRPFYTFEDARARFR